MSSSIFFKFKSQKDSQRVTFDGPGISVFEVKREIINISQLGDGTDFDLAIYNQDTNDEYDDDTTVIPRSTSVVARRLPARVPGAGRAARYVSGKMPVTAKNQHRREAQHNRQASEGQGASKANVAPDMNNAQTEEERIAAMFAADASSWEQQKEQMANAKPVFRGAGRGKPVNIPDRPPPPGYICYRCQEKGHWIQACPTNDDPEFDKKPRLRRTTGIPRSFQKTVEKPVASAVNDGLTDDTKQNSAVMVNAEGEFVIAVPDHQAFQKFQDKARAYNTAQKQDAASGSKELQERGLECPLDKRMFVEPMKTPCCGQTYCNDCIENVLINNDFVCPNCQTDGVLIDNLEPDDDMIMKIKAFEDEKTAQRKEKERSKSPPKVEVKVENADTPQAKVSAGSPGEGSKSPIKDHKSPQPTDDQAKAVSATPQPTTPNSSSKKRPAEEELENGRVPTGLAAAREQVSTSTSTPQLPAVPKSQQDFINQMNAMSTQLGGQAPSNNNMSFPMPNMSGMSNMGFPNPMMAMSMGGMMGMNPAMMNPMMMQQSGWGGGMNGVGFPSNNNGMFNNANNSMGFPQQPNGWNQNWPMNNGMGNQYPNQQQNGWQSQGQMNGNNGMGRGMGASFPNQQRAAGGDDDAYFRKPVNPHRHQNRQKRVRPSDYTEL